METGKIDRLLIERGFGFIKTADGRSIFFHGNSLEGVLFSQLSEGDRLEFETTNTPKGLNATNVRRVANAIY